MWMHFRAARWVQDERNRTLTYAREACRAAATEGEDKTRRAQAKTEVRAMGLEAGSSGNRICAENARLG